MTHLGQLQPVRGVISREDDLGRTSTASGHSLLAQTTNTQNLAGDGQLTSHGDGGVKRVVKRQRQERAGHGNTGRGAY